MGSPDTSAYLYPSANATKVERIEQMTYGEIKAYLLKCRYVLSVEKMGNQPPSSE